MMASLIDRKQLKAEVKALLLDAQVSPKAMAALYLAISLLLNMLSYVSGDFGILATFVSILTSLLSMVLSSGFVLYCMAIRRGERAEFLTLFDGFSFAGKVIALNIIMYVFICLWSMLFVIPGVIAAYRYRFALYNLYENPGIGAMEALAMSKRQTMGYKSQLLALDISYLGWSLLASLPVFFEGILVVQEYAAQLPSSVFTGSFTASPSAYSFLPAWAWTLVEGLWSLTIGLLYLPNYQCVELGYFDIAKFTSNTGAAPHQDPWSSGPDNMGGY